MGKITTITEWFAKGSANEISGALSGARKVILGKCHCCSFAIEVTAIEVSPGFS